MKSTVSAKGQITIPIAVRKQLGLTTNTIVVFDLREDEAVLRKAVLGKHPVDKVFGLLRSARSTDALALLDAMRGPRSGGPRARKRT
jgi:AbrB family looped-hinge helix DNA binding protein